MSTNKHVTSPRTALSRRLSIAAATAVVAATVAVAAPGSADASNCAVSSDTYYSAVTSIPLVHKGSVRGYAKGWVNWCGGVRSGKRVVTQIVSWGAYTSSTTSDPIATTSSYISKPYTGQKSTGILVTYWEIKEDRSLAADYHWSISEAVGYRQTCSLLDVTASGGVTRTCLANSV